MTPTMTPCTVEDGSLPGQSFPCMWDAATMGNGEGKSFVLDFAGDTPHYVTDVIEDGTILTNDDAESVTPVDAEPVHVDAADPAAAPEYVAEVGTAVPFTASELAETGMDAGVGSGIALALVVLGVVLRRLSRRAV